MKALDLTNYYLLYGFLIKFRTIVWISNARNLLQKDHFKLNDLKKLLDEKIAEIDVLKDEKPYKSLVKNFLFIFRCKNTTYFYRM